MPPAEADSPQEPIDVERALARLGDDRLVDLLRALWERRGWTVSDERTPDDRYVDLAVRKEWPGGRRGLVRMVRPSSDRPVSGTDVRHLVRDVQQEGVDWGHLVVVDHVSDHVASEGEGYDVDVVDVARLARFVRRSGARDLVARHVDVPVASGSGLLGLRALVRLRSAVERADAVDRLGEALARRGAGPTAVSLDRIAFLGFRITYALASGSFALLFVARTGSLAFWILTAIFLLAVYAGVLPSMALDVYLGRRTPTARAPSWTYLVAFLLPPLVLPAGAVYWYRRSEGQVGGEATG